MRRDASSLDIGAADDVRTTEDLRTKRMIGYVPNIIYAPELRYLEEIAGARRANFRSSSINTQARMIGSAAGIRVLPCFIGDADPALVAILPEIEVTRSFWLVTHKDTGNLASFRAFTDWLVALVAANKTILAPAW